MAWKFRHFELPDDHAFIYSMRGLADGVFKVFGWLALAGTFQVAAHTTADFSGLFAAFLTS
ncbi:hypothetical protein ABIF66_000528 [Bradyrhizobium japonicum]